MTVAEATADLRSGLATRLFRDRMAADGRLHNRDLSLPETAAAPAGLAKAVAAYNAAVAEFAARRDALDAGLADLALALDDSEISGAQVAGHVDALNAARFDLAQRHVGLLLAKKPILEDVAEHLERSLRLAETNLDQARERSRKALARAGFVPPAAHHNPGAAPEVERSQLEYAVSHTAPVCAAGAAVENVKAALDVARHLAGNVDNDLTLLRERVLVAWRRIVGAVV
ncbi:MAG TPA: hypothetical protein VM238_13455 [Phycisphaerae bacterium]|nr:hypothetical protein [Phycisphaerae bacterium]